MDFSNIKNFIFDLGGVIIDIDPMLTYAAFAEMIGKDHTYTINEFNRLQIFQRFEMGDLEEDAFKQYIRENTNINCSDEDLYCAWNKLLLDIPAERIDVLKKINAKYRSFLLSNTNSIHIPAVEKILHESCGVASLEELFEKVYYSYKIKKLKPSEEIYKFVLAENNLEAEETVFIDDNLANIEAAARLGIKTIHIQAPLTILDHLKDA